MNNKEISIENKQVLRKGVVIPCLCIWLYENKDTQ
jgi:hypothetical protein